MQQISSSRQASISLGRIWPRIEAEFAALMSEADLAAFKERLEANFETLFGLLSGLYSGHYDFFYHLENAVRMAARMWAERPPALKQLDREREADPQWFQSQRMAGGVLYVDLFAGDLEGVRSKIPYLQELGLTYLHLMPLFLAPEGNSDGGYAVSSYRDVNPALGTMEQLSSLADDLRDAGISLVLDFVFNHTSDEHVWARRAVEGDPDYRDYYYIFPDRTMPDRYERTLREIFPDVRPGNFTHRQDLDGWVWTTFNSFQWDLNYSNPAVFTGMAEEMLNLANRGAEILRLDALAFVWKEMGTTSENLPQSHTLIRAFNCMARIAAPSLLFKSEAIVHPDDVNRYISREECQLSYNPLLMALLWEALATREVKLLQTSMRDRFAIDPRCAWVNYIRSHDDIGWTFDDNDAARLGINGFGHRRFLNAFYTGRFEGSFARGVPFQENPRTGDARISGTCASLAGLESALKSGDPTQIEHSVRRIILLYSVAFSMGGIPLIYLGDELGTLNDYSYLEQPGKASDSRWVHRPRTDWDKVARRNEPGTIERRIFSAMLALLGVRAACPAFAGGATRIFDAGNEHVLGYVRTQDGEQVTVLCNFSEHRQEAYPQIHGRQEGSRDLVTGEWVSIEGGVALPPYGFVWLLEG